DEGGQEVGRHRQAQAGRGQCECQEGIGGAEAQDRREEEGRHQEKGSDQEDRDQEDGNKEGCNEEDCSQEGHGEEGRDPEDGEQEDCEEGSDPEAGPQGSNEEDGSPEVRGQEACSEEDGPQGTGQEGGGEEGSAQGACPQAGRPEGHQEVRRAHRKALSKIRGLPAMGRPRPTTDGQHRDTAGSNWPMAVKIDKKIKGYSVVRPEDKAAAAKADAVPRVQAEAELAMADIIQMHEKIERPEVLVGSTYKIKSPLVEHAMYVTINDIVLNQGTEHELRRPFEIFVNSKSMEHFQWIVALTRIMSAVFRKGGDVTFLVDEMK